MINNIKDYLGCFTYIFTKFPEKEHNGIQKMTKDIYDNLPPAEESDVAFKSLIRDLTIKVARNKH